jgi:hypothetical protein
MVLGWCEAWHFAHNNNLQSVVEPSQRLTQTKHQHNNNNSSSRGLLTNYCATISTLPPSVALGITLFKQLVLNTNWEKASHIDATYYCLFPLGEK